MTSRKRIGYKAANEAPPMPKLQKVLPQVNRFPSRMRVQCPDPSDRNGALQVGDEKHSLFAELHNRPEKDKCLSESGKGLPVVNFRQETKRASSEKIKLQLFPVDEGTRVGLENDGYHPYLELCLSSRKKISSVLRHINGKWGSSSVAHGEPILFPHHKDSTTERWSLSDTNISAGDVYAAIGGPSVFRLRYGWTTSPEAKSIASPSVHTPIEGCFTSKTSNSLTVKQDEAANENLKPVLVGGAVDLVADKESSPGLDEQMGNERQIDGDKKSLTAWDDGLTNISIGGLLSEASLLGIFNNHESKLNNSNSGQRPLNSLISESLDAFLASRVNWCQDSKPPVCGSNSSILDAEDTCHAFPSRKFSSGNGVQSSASTSFRCPKITKDNVDSGPQQDHGNQKSETELSLSSRVFNDDNSLGLSAIKWTESSLGPFELGLSSKNIISNDSVSLTRFLS